MNTVFVGGRHAANSFLALCLVGNGKSVFMAYFFLRYQLEHANSTIILASFTYPSYLMAVVVWKDGHAATSLVLDIRLLAMEYEEDPDAIFLFDGPAGMALRRHRYVVFTNPSARWFRGRWKDWTHTTTSLPLWDAEELVDAVDALDIEEELPLLDVEAFPRRDDSRHSREVVYRFDIFGGDARPCLASDRSFLKSQLRHLEDTTARFGLATTAMRNYAQAMRESVYHHIPADSWYLHSRVKVASPYVAQMLRKQFESLLDADKERVLSFSCGSPEAVALRQCILAPSVHQALENGAQLVPRHLAGNDGTPLGHLDLEILKSTPVELVKDAFELGNLADGAYFKPESKTFESIDALYFVKTERNEDSTSGRNVGVILFQIAGSDTHPVKAKDVCAVLKRLGIGLDSASERVALVFAVPQSRAGTFHRQHIDCTNELDNDRPTTAVDGVTSAMTAAFEEASVRTVGALRALPTDTTLTAEQLETYKATQGLLRRHENERVATGSDALRALERLPQFVWGV